MRFNLSFARKTYDIFSPWNQTNLQKKGEEILPPVGCFSELPFWTINEWPLGLVFPLIGNKYTEKDASHDLFYFLKETNSWSPKKTAKKGCWFFCYFELQPFCCCEFFKTIISFEFPSHPKSPTPNRGCSKKRWRPICLCLSPSVSWQHYDRLPVDRPSHSASSITGRTCKEIAWIRAARWRRRGGGGWENM